MDCSAVDVKLLRGPGRVRKTHRLIVLDMPDRGLGVPRTIHATVLHMLTSL